MTSVDTKITEDLQDRLEDSESEVRIILKTTPDINSTARMNNYGEINHNFRDQNLIALTASKETIMELSSENWVERIGLDKKVSSSSTTTAAPE
ncbi:hypothetical protein GLT90_00935 [Nanohaloarchaea archaeon H12]|nr:hypothetical protein [Nanohaloarchaea archaeon H12]